MRCAILLVLPGCLAAAPPPPPVQQPASPAATVEEQPAPAPEPEVFPLHSEWAGRYKCGQGFTGVRLVIDAHSTGEAIATFEFGALPENPGVPSGAYQLRGRLQRTVDGGFEAKLSPDQWLDQPAGYVMVGVTAVTDAERHVLRGTIDSPACSGFEVRRRR